MIDLIWTYTTKFLRPSGKWEISDECIQCLYKESISKGKKYGNTWLYTDKEGAEKLGKYVDSLVILPTDFDYYFIDDIKFYVLENHPGRFCLIDGDLMLESSIKISPDTLGFEHLLTYDDSYYKPYNEILDFDGISSVVPFWEKDQDASNIGLVHIPNDFPRHEFIELYKNVKSFYKDKIEPKRKFLKKNICIEMSVCTYLLSLFVNYKKISYIYLNQHTKFNHFATFPIKHKFCSEIASKTTI